MSDESPKPGKTRRSVPPYNPGLHNLVLEKQTRSEPLDETATERGFRGWHQRGYLPHRDVPGLTQFVTFRLADAMPASRQSEWEMLLRIEESRQRRTRLETYLDKGYGQCWLKRPDIAVIARNALLFFHGARCEVQAWVVMPNHVHVLVQVGSVPMARLIQSWKRFTAREANSLLGRNGTFWEREYWDTFIRDENHRRRAVRYIETNPVKGGLVAEAAQWKWSSARFRDRTGSLRLPMR
jgi:REP element-mobilizing transposase RayT